MSTQLKELLSRGVACLEQAEDRESFATGLMDAASAHGVDCQRTELDAFLDEAFNPGSTVTDEELEVVASGCTCAFCTCSYMVATM